MTTDELYMIINWSSYDSSMINKFGYIEVPMLCIMVIQEKYKMKLTSITMLMNAQFNDYGLPARLYITLNRIIYL